MLAAGKKNMQSKNRDYLRTTPTYMMTLFEEIVNS